jgi:chaperonin GroES
MQRAQKNTKALNRPQQKQQQKRSFSTSKKQIVKKAQQHQHQHQQQQQSKRSLSTDAVGIPFQPTSNRILVKKDVIEKPKTAGGILLPQSQAKNTNPLATVVAVGPGLRNNEGKYVPTFTQIGDKVVLPEFGGAELKFNNEAFHLYRDDDVLGVIGSVDVASRINAV